MVSLRLPCDAGWQRSGREGWPSCMIKSRRGGRERPKGGRESDFPFACTHSGRSQVFFLVRRVVSCCVHTLPRRQCVSFLPSLSCPPRPSMLCRCTPPTSTAVTQHRSVSSRITLQYNTIHGKPVEIATKPSTLRDTYTRPSSSAQNHFEAAEPLSNKS